MNRVVGILVLACASVSICAQDASTLVKQADAQAKAGQYRQAAVTYKKAIAADPGSAQAYSGLGDAYNRLNMPSDAATAYEKAADLLTAEPAAPAARPQAAQPAAARPQAAAPAARARAGAGAQVDPQATPAAAAAKRTVPAAGNGGGGLEGLYLMTRFWNGTGLEVKTYRFHNGVVVEDPIGPGQNLDVDAERAVHPAGVGTFRRQGGQLTMTFPSSDHAAKFEPEEKGCFGWDAGIFRPVQIFAPGTTLNGTFTGGASVGGGAVMSSTTITFRPDGTYVRDSIGTYNVSGASGGSTHKEQGRYRIDGTSLHMMPDGGKETVVSTFPWDDGTSGPAPRRVYFGGGMLSRL